MTLPEAKARWASPLLTTLTLAGSTCSGMPSAIVSLSSTGTETVSPSRTVAVSSCTSGSESSSTPCWSTSISPVVRWVPSLTVYRTTPRRP